MTVNNSNIHQQSAGLLSSPATRAVAFPTRNDAIKLTTVMTNRMRVIALRLHQHSALLLVSKVYMFLITSTDHANLNIPQKL